MRCWASFAVSVAVLIGQPYYLLASTPSAVQISAAEDSASEAAQGPVRHSVGDKKVARKIQDEPAARPQSAGKSAPPTSSVKTTRKLTDKLTNVDSAVRPAAAKPATRKLADDGPKSLVVTAAPAIQPPKVAQARQAVLPQPVVQPRRAAVAKAAAPKTPSVSRQLVDEPVGTGVASPPVGRSVESAPEVVAKTAPFTAPAPAALVIASKPAAPSVSIPAVASAPKADFAAAPQASFPVARPRVVQTVADSAPIVSYATPPSTPIRRSFSVQAASQPGPMPTPAVRSAVPQPEPDTDANTKSASDAPIAQAPQQHEKSSETYVDGDYCLDCDDCECCDDCRYGICDLHRDLKEMGRNMHPHYPYDAQPWTYYYFRPYHFRHIEAQQQEAMAWGADPSQPYSRKMFDKIYDDVEKQMAEKEAGDED